MRMKPIIDQRYDGVSATVGMFEIYESFEQDPAILLSRHSGHVYCYCGRAVVCTDPNSIIVKQMHRTIKQKFGPLKTSKFVLIEDPKRGRKYSNRSSESEKRALHNARRHKCESILSRWINDDTYCESQLAWDGLLEKIGTGWALWSYTPCHKRSEGKISKDLCLGQEHGWMPSRKREPSPSRVSLRNSGTRIGLQVQIPLHLRDSPNLTSNDFRFESFPSNLAGSDPKRDETWKSWW